MAGEDCLVAVVARSFLQDCRARKVALEVTHDRNAEEPGPSRRCACATATGICGHVVVDCSSGRNPRADPAAPGKLAAGDIRQHLMGARHLFQLCVVGSTQGPLTGMNFTRPSPLNSQTARGLWVF